VKTTRYNWEDKLTWNSGFDPVMRCSCLTFDGDRYRVLYYERGSDKTWGWYDGSTLMPSPRMWAILPGHPLDSWPHDEPFPSVEGND
jgi:hypothetical protein